MNNFFKNILIICSLLFIVLFYIFNSQYIINSILDYSILFIKNIFPISFIINIISYLLINYNIISIMNPYLYIYFISIISGTPNGIRNIYMLYKNNMISEGIMNRIIMYSHSPNIIFLIHISNCLINNKRLSIITIISILSSNFIIMLLLIRKERVNSSYSYNSFSYLMSEGINSSFNVIINVYGTSLFFYIILCIILKLFKLSGIIYVTISSIFDITKGLYSTSIINNIYYRCISIIIIMSIGSIPIQIQNRSIINDTSINYKYYIIGRIIGTLLGIFIFKILVLF